ncbi:ribosome small subunit-dependent GTPase A [Fusibacter sp. 3D3]|uniref:ribosome small subunit-dependent GTPase A n=1 Tax=Fusibacter sp. 3D3 TaxID=1048380 RepID=UPI000853B0DD|nr:ribosome small subunit-dependent GTPase A [Fusibacter sp. 3D3]GAU75574.1 probable GTPase related to EngC [Fusibacter sp. 3D3]
MKKQNDIEIMTLNAYGWNMQLESRWTEILNKSQNSQKKLHRGRILLDYGQRFKVITEHGEKWLGRPTQSDVQLAVGDWVLMTADDYQEDEAHFESLMNRKTKFSRMAAGVEVKEQIVATNVDIVFLVQSLNKDFNPRRLERYLIATWESGATPVVVLTKSDLCDDFAENIQKVNEIAVGVDVHAISALTGEGIAAIRPYFKAGVTVALLGSSGVGKSTLVNTLMGSEILETQDIREYDSKGRHTTTHRELVLLPEGGLILDTPGMRSLALWDAEEGMSHFFGDIEQLLMSCRFSNCGHRHEPGCAIQEALKSGQLKQAHWESWKKLQNEQKHLDQKLKQKTRAMDKAQSHYHTKKEHKNTIIKRAREDY